MKTKLLSCLLVCMTIVTFSSCLNDNEPKKDVTDEIGMTVSSEKGMMYPWESEIHFECMLMKSDDNPDEWKELAMGDTSGFTFQIKND